MIHKESHCRFQDIRMVFQVALVTAIATASLKAEPDLCSITKYASGFTHTHTHMSQGEYEDVCRHFEGISSLPLQNQSLQI